MTELLLAILFSTLIIVSFRLISKLQVDELQSIVFNYLFATIWGLLIWRQNFTIEVITGKPWFAVSLLVGTFFIITFFLMSRSTRHAGVAITAVASRMSVLIPITAGFLIFGDSITFQKVFGISLAIVSFFLIFKPSGKLKINTGYFLTPILLCIGIGTNDTTMKYIQHHYLNGDESLFLTVVFFVAFVYGMIYLGIVLARQKTKLSYKGVIAGFALGSFNFGSTYFFMLAMAQFEASFFFPVFNVSIVSLTALTGYVFFREKLSRMNWIGIIIAIIAIMIISGG